MSESKWRFLHQGAAVTGWRRTGWSVHTLAGPHTLVEMVFSGPRGSRREFILASDEARELADALVICAAEMDRPYGYEPDLKERVARLEARVTELEKENVKIKRELQSLKLMTIPWMRRQYACVFAVLTVVDRWVTFYSGEYDHRSSSERLEIAEYVLRRESRGMHRGDDGQLFRRLAQLGAFKVRAEAESSLLETLPRPVPPPGPVRDSGRESDWDMERERLLMRKRAVQ